MVTIINKNSSSDFPRINYNTQKSAPLIMGVRLQNKNNDIFPNFIQAQALKNQILFTSDLDKGLNNIEIARIGMNQMDEILNQDLSNEPFNYPDWYKKLRDLLCPNYNDAAKNSNSCPTTNIDYIFCNDSKKEIKLIRDTLQAMIGATKYNPTIKDGIPVPIHNQELVNKIQPYYTSSSFEELFNFCDKEKHVFNLKFTDGDTSGIPQTSVINPDEDVNMSQNIWVTDTCRNISVMKDKCPKNCYKALKTLSDYYKSQDDIFKTIIKEPKKYNQLCGLGHLFSIDSSKIQTEDGKTSIIKSFKTQDIYPKTRLESTGIYLSTLCDIVTGELAKGKDYGLKTNRQNNEEIVYPIVNIVKYLEAIDYSYAPSCGNWEEKTFYNKGLTSDTEIVNNGLRKVRDLLYSEEYDSNEEISKIRDDVNEELSVEKENFKKTLNAIIDIGEKRVKENYLQESPGERDADAALAFVTHTAKLDDDLVKDVEKNIKILSFLDNELVGNNGIRRYNNDHYKSLNYDIALNYSGEIINYKEKETCKNEAQWFMVSDISKGYGVQLKKLLDKIETDNTHPSEDELKLIKLTYQKETEFINRAYARITGKDKFGQPNIKANGKECPSFTLPEAYQAVSTLQLSNPHTKNGINLKEKKATYVPGTNTPLAWAQSSLYDASKLFRENLARLEKLNNHNFINLPQLEENNIHPDTKMFLAASIYI
jgi:hypothetical protein